MNKQTEAMKLTLEGAANYIDALGGDSRKYRQALAEQPAQQEPVALVDGEGKQLTLMQALDHAIKATEKTGSGRLNKVLVTAKRALEEQPAQQCKECDGDGVVLASQHSLKCPECNGTGIKPAQPQQKPVASKQTFTRAWLRLDELPGTMMQGPEGLFGPIPGSTSTWVTTSERERDHQISNGNPMLEVYTSPQPVQQEPVAMRYDFDGYGWKYIDSGSGSDWKTRIKGAEPIYTSPPAQRKPLTDEQAYKAIKDWTGDIDTEDEPSALDIFRAAEAAHGIKGDA